MKSAFLVDAIRTPIGKFKGALADVRTDDLAAHVLKAILERNGSVLPKLDQVVFGATSREWLCCSRACRTKFPP